MDKNYKSNVSVSVLSLVLNKVTEDVFLMSNGNLFNIVSVLQQSMPYRHTFSD